MKILIYLLLISCCGCSKIPDNQAILAIIGESSNQGYFGMRLVACAIRHRGTLKGVYGVKHIPRINNEVARDAYIAWYNSLGGPDVCLGADSWYSKEDLAKYGTPINKVFVFQYGNHFFYKPIKKGESHEY